MDEIKNLVDEVHGWLTHSEGQLLFRLAKACTGRGVIVEIGSWKGKSTIWLAKGSRSGNKVKIHAIDPHTGSPEEAKSYGKVLTFEEFTANVKNAGVDDTVIPIIKTSSEAAQEFREPIELIFIDGDHQYDMVKLDFELWFPKVIDGGIMAFHDTIWTWDGPKNVVKEWVFKSKHFTNAKFLDTITFAEKVAQNGIKDRIMNRLTLSLKDFYEFGHSRVRH